MKVYFWWAGVRGTFVWVSEGEWEWGEVYLREWWQVDDFMGMFWGGWTFFIGGWG